MYEMFRARDGKVAFFQQCSYWKWIVLVSEIYHWSLGFRFWSVVPWFESSLNGFWVEQDDDVDGRYMSLVLQSMNWNFDLCKNYSLEFTATVKEVYFIISLKSLSVFIYIVKRKYFHKTEHEYYFLLKVLIIWPKIYQLFRSDDYIT